MSSYTATEANRFFRFNGTKCDNNEVEKWMKDTPTIHRGKQVDEWDMYAFNDWLRCKGTSYGLGIDDQTKISRMIEEIKELKKENEALKKEIYKLETGHENLPF